MFKALPFLFAAGLTGCVASATAPVVVDASGPAPNLAQRSLVLRIRQGAFERRFGFRVERRSMASR